MQSDRLAGARHRLWHGLGREPSRRGRAARIAATYVLLAATAAMSLAACSGFRASPKPQDPNVMPTDYKRQLQTELHRRMADPVGVRDAFISTPALHETAGVERYISCMRYTAKDETGAYAPPRERVAYFYHGQLTQIVDEDAPELCRRVPYQPWPELTRMCKEVVCPGK
jgi:hypothetical protein